MAAMRAPDLPREPPHNVELEQALLGAILLDNRAFDKITFLGPDDFHEGLHGKLFGLIAELITGGKIANPVTLKDYLSPELKALKIGRLSIHQYLAKLSADATTIVGAPDYARGIADLARRRRVIEIAEDLRDAALVSDDPLLASKARDAFAEIAKAPDALDGRLLKTVAEFLADFVPPDYVVDGILKRGFLYSLTAMTGSGKTAIALLISEIASNRKRRRKLGPHEIEHVRVVYIACENAEDVRARLIGMEAKLDFDRNDLDLLIIDKVFDLEKNLDRIRKEVEAFGGDIGLVFIDTSAAMFQGDDDNNNVQALHHAKTQRKLCDLPGRPCVVALVHPIKHVDSPEKLLPRGGGAYLNEMDGNLTAWAHGERMSRLHWTGKLRGVDFEPIEFRLPTIFSTNLADRKGRLMPTVMAEIATDAAILEAEEKAAIQDKRLLLAIFDRPSGSIAQWALDCGWTMTAKPGEEARPYKSLVQRVLKRLTERALVKATGDGHSLTAAGNKTAKEYHKIVPATTGTVEAGFDPSD
jgi:DnaB-like helicase N terminal domain/AAA domain